MADDRILPNLKSRLTLDSSELAKAKEAAAGLKGSLASAGDGAAEAGQKLDSGLINPLKLATTAAGIFAAKKIFDFGRAGFAELADAEKAMAQTNATLKATGGIANVTADDVSNLASSLSNMSGVDDQVVQAGANMLLTFKAVKNEVGEGNKIFDRATQAALDLSTAGFGSMESASVMLGKALQDPVKGVTALQRVGVGFTDSQKALIAQLVQTGDVLGAQKVILKEVESQVGGSAKAYGETLPGQIAKAKNSLDDMKASIIVGAAPAINFLAEKVNAAAQFISGLPEPIRATIGALGVGAAGFLGLARPINEVITLLARFKTSQEAAALAATAAGTAEAGADAEAAVAAQAMAVADAEAALAAQGLTAAEIEAALGAQGLAVAEGEAAAGASALTAALVAIVAVVASVVAVWYGLEHAQTLSVDVSKAAKTSTDDLVAGLKKLGAEQSAGIALEAFRKIAEGNIGTAIRLRDGLAASGIETSKYDEIIRQAAEGQKQLNADQKAGTAITQESTVAVVDLAAESAKLKSLQDELATSVNSVGSALDSAYGRTVDPIKLVADLAAKTDDLTKALKENGVTLDINTEAGRKNQAAVLGAGEAVAKLIEQKFKETGSLQEAQAAGNAYVDGLRVQMAQAGLNQTQIDSMIATMHLTPAEIATTFSTNSPEVQAVVDQLKTHIDEIPLEKQTDFLAHVDAGEYAAAQKMLDDLAAARAVQYEIQFNVALMGGFDPTVPGRAWGGPVKAGKPYIVGEHRPELFVPTVDGTIRPDVPTGWGGSGPSGVTVENHWHVDGEMSAFTRRQLEQFATDAAHEAVLQVVG